MGQKGASHVLGLCQAGARAGMSGRARAGMGRDPGEDRRLLPGEHPPHIALTSRLPRSNDPESKAGSTGK